MALPQTSPHVDNYMLGKGACYFLRDGDSPEEYRHMGNCAEAEFTPSAETLEHFSSLAGVRKKDKVVYTQLGGQLRILFEEWTPDNLALALLGAVTSLASPTGHSSISILSTSTITGKFRFVGANDVGPKYRFDLNKVQFAPSGSIPLISDEWGQVEITAEALVDTNGDFGAMLTIA